MREEYALVYLIVYAFKSEKLNKIILEFHLDGKLNSRMSALKFINELFIRSKLQFTEFDSVETAIYFNRLLSNRIWDLLR